MSCFNPHNPTRLVLFIIPFLYKLRNWGTKMLGVLPEILQLVRGTIRIQSQVRSPGSQSWFSTIILHSLLTITNTVLVSAFYTQRDCSKHFAYLCFKLLTPGNWITLQREHAVCLRGHSGQYPDAAGWLQNMAHHHCASLPLTMKEDTDL